MMKRTIKRLLLAAGLAWIALPVAGAVERFPIRSGWEFRQRGLGAWLPAEVPGTVHTDLLRNGLIPDPCVGNVQESLQWIDKVDWEYRCRFDAAEALRHDHVRICFEGVDCYADIYLNDSLIVRAQNMFRTWNADVGALLRERDNRLRVVFRSPTMEGLARLTAYGTRLTANNDLAALGGLGDNRVSVFTRKPGYQYGWDLAPRYVTSGLWKPVVLEAWDDLRLEDLYVATCSIGRADARMAAEVTLRSDRSEKCTLRLSVNGEPVAERVQPLVAGTSVVELPFVIRKPRLWYPNGMGEPYLYDVELVVERQGRVADRRAIRCGVRTSELVYEDDPDGKGRCFYLKINGEPVFCKGSNYVPADAFLPRLTPERVEHLVSSAARANMNMLRVWGGGIYESDDFYALCDRYGIMVWQDFIFACNMYPGSEALYADLRAEAADNVRRLRNHPSVVLWCGNNEIDVAWKPHDKPHSRFRKFYTEEQAAQFDRVNETIFRRLLPGVVDSLCAGRVPYWHSSPSPGWGLDTVDRWRYGDVHNWDVWHGGDPIEAYNTQIARFCSEYGLQSYPEYASVAQFIPAEERFLASPSMTSHQGDRKKGDKRMLEYIDRQYVRDGDFARTLYLSQLMQAEGMRTAMEANRRNRPYCMGSLVWQLNDVWPCASWSGIDYYGRWKAMHYLVGHACEEVIVSLYRHGDTLEVHVVSDLRKPLRGTLELSLRDFAGRELHRRTLPVRVEAAAARCVVSAPVGEWLRGADPAASVLVCTLRAGDRAAGALHYFVTMKQAALPDATLRLSAERVDDATCRITLSSDALVKNLMLRYDGVGGIFSDNYFDLLPGQPRSVTLAASEDPDAVLAKIDALALNPKTSIIRSE